MFEFDVCIAGTGRVGLPLGLSLMESGAHAVGLDRDATLREQVNAGSMPFAEPGYTELVRSRRFQVHGSPEIVAQARALVITVGTPLHNHVETDLGQIRAVLESVRPYVRPGQLICLRSTVAPGTTRYVSRWLERHTNLAIGKELRLAFCPERIVEGKAYEELRTLPQIIGTEDPESAKDAAALFGRLTNDLLHSDFVTAELVKLFNNITRYVHFALANHLALVSDTLGANIFEIQRLTNYKYPRHGVASPGFTAGTCLRKDFGMINEWTPYPDLLLSAWKMNEYMPMFVVQHLRQRTQLFERRVLVLGYTFKADSDDTRDSLVPKLLRYLERELPSELRVSDHHLPDPIVDSAYGTAQNWNAKVAIEEIDCVIVATNHTGYLNVLREVAKRRPTAWIADLWNVGKCDKVFYQAQDLAKADWDKMKTLITGAAGFIGYALAKRLADDPTNELIVVDNFIRGERDAGYLELCARPNVTALELDLSAPHAVERLPTTSIDYLFHLAAFNGTQNFYEQPYEVLRHSTLPAFALIDKYVVTKAVRNRFVYAGSSEAYASTISKFNWAVPTKEDVPLCIDDPTNARWSYGASKLHGEVLTCVACKHYGVPFSSIRYHNVYGPRMGDKHVVPDFVSRMSRGVYELYGHEDTRSFLYIDDAVTATLALAQSLGAVDQVVNIGSADEVVIKRLGDLMLEAAGVSADIVLYPSPAGSVKRRSPDVSKLRALTGFEPRWSLEQGLRETVAWYLAHPTGA